MEKRAKRLRVYKTMMRRRVFTEWANLLLRCIDKQVVDFFDANERRLLDDLFGIVLVKTEEKYDRSVAGDTKQKQRAVLVNRAQTFNQNYYKEKQGQRKDVNRPVVLQFIWDLIEYYHISPYKSTSRNDCRTNMNAKDILLHWVNGKLRSRRVKNFTNDWNDGVALCELINALEPGLIPTEFYLQGSWPLKNAQVALDTAEKTWDIPGILSAEDITSNDPDELSVMTYVSLLFEYDMQRLRTNSEKMKQAIEIQNREKLKSPKWTNKKCNGETEKEAAIGRVGKIIEYILNFHDMKASEITISVEYKPLAGIKHDYKPDLKVMSLGQNKFRVKYTPNVAGFYKLSMFYRGDHIGESPYCVQVLPHQNGRVDTNNNHTPDKIPGYISDKNSASRFYGFDGEGLRDAVVGKLAVFTVITDNRDKGPLSVCINCPAVSIPVPHVSTLHSPKYSTHTVAYMPTLPGTYKLYVRWGLKLINDRPFHVTVVEKENDSRRYLHPRISDPKNRKRLSTEFSHIKVYYSASSLDPSVIQDTSCLEELFKHYGLTKASHNDIWVSIDVELERDERDLVFRLAGTKRLPLVFVHEKCLGGCEEVVRLHKLNELEETLRYKIRQV